MACLHLHFTLVFVSSWFSTDLISMFSLFPLCPYYSIFIPYPFIYSHVSFFISHLILIIRILIVSLFIISPLITSFHNLLCFVLEWRTSSATDSLSATHCQHLPSCLPPILRYDFTTLITYIAICFTSRYFFYPRHPILGMLSNWYPKTHLGSHLNMW